MPRLAANVSTMFRELPILERFGKARELGFEAVEMQFPYDLAAADIAHALQDANLTLALINAPAGDINSGDRGLVTEESCRFDESIRIAVDYACTTGCRRIHVLIGKTASGLRGPLWKQVVTRLRAAAGALDRHRIDLMLEPLNRHDQPSYALPTVDAADDLRRALEVGNARLLFDVYHVERSGGDAIAALRNFMPSIGHVQISRVPDRTEPDPDRARAVFDALDLNGYGGYVGCEYNPRQETTAGLAWAHPYGIGRLTN